MQVKVFVTPRSGILDPQGKAVEHALKSLGFQQVTRARVGKYITLDINASSAEEARAAAQKMCEQLLANTLFEEFRFEVLADSPGPVLGATSRIAVAR